MGMRIYSDSAIDDFSMAPECFGLNIDPDELGDYNYYDPVFEEKTTPHNAFADKTCEFYTPSFCLIFGNTYFFRSVCYFTVLYFIYILLCLYFILF